ncbi:glycoside hydrolase family 32 protein [Marinimicrobium sp. ARAG 43.8]|uniref:glycoside hydrolase family 32 protein n=1 Tax=Marinimicrobium sp. ARAG 43.8 TaxID=3418719 RepID=UPI003CF02B54
MLNSTFKLSLASALALALAGCNGNSQNPASGPASARTTSDSVTSDSARYQERYRPQFHYTPHHNWMNDPNGLVYHNGEYHMFYQYNPHGDKWGHMSWGHAVSRDLVHWEELGVALPEDDDNMIFSGSAVVDHHNTTGFGSRDNPPLVAIYTGHRQPPAKGQDQRLAYSLDNGRTWTKYQGNPVLDENMTDFRDPKVIWHEESQQWIMVVALSTEYKVAFYGSQDLKDWTLLSQFESPESALGIWECPDLFALPIDGDSEQRQWVLEIDLGAGEEGSVAGGSGGLYFVGEFDGQRFIPDEDALPASEEGPHQWVDYGKDFYAAVSWSDVPEEDGRRLWVGWMNNWQYAQDLPTSPWRSSQSIPRALELVRHDGGLKMVQEPVEELQVLRGEQRSLTALTLDSESRSLADHGVAGKALELKVTFANVDADAFGLKVRTGKNEQTILRYDQRDETLSLDRTRSGEVDFHADFPGVHVAPMPLEDGKVSLHVFVDWSSVEVFGQGGTVVISDKIFPSSDSDGVEVFAEGGEVTVETLNAWPLKSIW